jgi:hypothetical protein
MLAAKDLQSIARACTAISEGVADQSGFVPVRKLLERFDVSLVIRPLLVEGMLASLPGQFGEGTRSKFAVLIDSETFQGVTDKEVAGEAAASPLPPRFRTTVAHELLHALAFRPGQFGLRLEQPVDDEKRVSEFVEAIEHETERLTPLLLWPEKALNSLIHNRKRAITPGELANLTRQLGISRQIAVTRLRLRGQKDGLAYAPWLRDVAIGIAEWGEGGRALFRKWPLFANFDRNIIPSFIHSIASQDRLPATAVFDEENFAMRGGQYTAMTLLVDAGLKDTPKVQAMSVRVAIEGGVRKPGTEFFFVVRKTRPDDKPATDAEEEAL